MYIHCVQPHASALFHPLLFSTDALPLSFHQHCVSFYTSSYFLGEGLSFFIAGVLSPQTEEDEIGTDVLHNRVLPFLPNPSVSLSLFMYFSL